MSHKAWREIQELHEDATDFHVQEFAESFIVKGSQQYFKVTPKCSKVYRDIKSPDDLLMHIFARRLQTPKTIITRDRALADPKQPIAQHMLMGLLQTSDINSFDIERTNVDEPFVGEMVVESPLREKLSFVRQDGSVANLLERFQEHTI